MSLFGVQGCTSRLGYWRVQLLCAVSLTVVWMLGLFALLGVGPIGGVLFLPLPAIVVISVAAWLRRLHDRGKGPWWAFLFCFGPWICLAIARALAETGSTALIIASCPSRWAD